MNTQQAQSGNVIFIILIAVALLAALSYAVSETFRGGTQDMSAEKARLYASEILEYSSIVSNAVTQLRLRGVLETELCFDHAEWTPDYDHAGCGDDEHQIFHPDGGGVVWRNAPSEAMDSSATPDNLWHIYSGNEVDLVGLTDGDAASQDLVLIVDELSQNVCIQINNLLDISNPSGAPPTGGSIVTTEYVGTFVGIPTTISTTSELSGRKAACYYDTVGTEHRFYKVLLTR